MRAALDKEGFARALVTGASSGIGKEFARQIARRGSTFIIECDRGLIQSDES